MTIYAIVAVVVSYLIGSINFAVIFTKLFNHDDIRNYGSGNAGTTNVMRVGGIVPGTLTFLFDALKGFVACFIGKTVFSCVNDSFSAEILLPLSGAYICAVACILGHIFPVFFNFKGGKGVATCVGVFAVCCPIAIVIGLLVFAVVTLISRYVSLGSLIATVVVVVAATVFRTDDTSALVQIVCCFIMATLIFCKHGGNIKRLLSGTERKIGEKV